MKNDATMVDFFAFFGTPLARGGMILISVSAAVLLFFYCIIQAHRYPESISIPSWSRLKNIGQSKLTQLTIFIPFIGSLIMFNSTVIDYLSISVDAVKLWTGSHDSSSTAKLITLNRITIIYFGLCLIGTSAFFYSILAPEEIRKYDQVGDFVSVQSPLVTRARIGSLTSKLANQYLEALGPDEFVGIRGPQGTIQRFFSQYRQALKYLGYPEIERESFHSIFNQIAWNSNSETYTDNEENTENERLINPSSSDEEWKRGMMTATGEINVDRVAEIIRNRIRVWRGYWSSFDDEAMNHIQDLLVLNYSVSNHRRPAARLLISIGYGLGFFILSLSTLETFVLIAGGLTGLR